ncbi:MAG TPA: hypothetical protein DCE56_35490 [Cyanobacteria bacterium UBA8553]|nr:hypothetical protein [Cyanobacteria bacterium UBA8553]HAJ59831.1 hypothetical protein [Cyanobacteria bacterium UBA8543]
MTLVKATLIGIDGGENIKFMFNPTEITFSRTISLEQPPGAQTDKGENKVSFKHPNPYSLKISNIIFDTYEEGTSVLNYITKLKAAVEFSKSGEGQSKRPPIYLFTWGDTSYLRCFVKTLTFKLTMFLDNGTPVRASVDLDLEQVESSTPLASMKTPNLSPEQRAAFNRDEFLESKPSKKKP